MPSTIYSVSTAVSTYVSNGVSYVTSYGVTTVVSISYIPKTATETTTTVSIRPTTVRETVSGPTVTASGSGGGGGSGVVTVYGTVTETYRPSSSKSSFTCRTYATNYLNGMHGKLKRDGTRRRSVFDVEVVLDEKNAMPMPGARPEPWFNEV